LFYHQPKFAVLDESTSAVSSDVEGLMYDHAKDMGFTLITISHRPSLLKYHDILLTLTGEKGQWKMSTLREAGDESSKRSNSNSNNNTVFVNIEKEIKQLKKQLENLPKLKERLSQIKRELMFPEKK
jgi:ATP-binding cassette subfamily D (ALD) long-chain fatty acid import protein